MQMRNRRRRAQFVSTYAVAAYYLMPESLAEKGLKDVPAQDRFAMGDRVMPISWGSTVRCSLRSKSLL